MAGSKADFVKKASSCLGNHNPASGFVTMGSAWHRAAVDGHEIKRRDRYGQTALLLAAAHDHRELVDLLIRHRAYLDMTAK